MQYSGHRNPRASTGFWVQIQLPADLAGMAVGLQAAIFENMHLSRQDWRVTNRHVYDQFIYGNWVDPNQLGTLPGTAGGQHRPADFAYTGTEQHRLWQVWIELRIDSPILEMAIKYPWGILQHERGVPYRFRLALDRDAEEADRIVETSGGDLKEDADIALPENGSELMQLAIPD
ncbi:hypothetical protein ACCD02_32445 [Pseudomonas sp. Pseusp88]|uniref:hypothetical protein n=1 Tax=Pseudomonas sp. Pseusp88 TaxID=3243061 RepID=UPI0039A4BF8A